MLGSCRIWTPTQGRLFCPIQSSLQRTAHDKQQWKARKKSRSIIVCLIAVVGFWFQEATDVQ